MSEADTYVQDLARLRSTETALRNELTRYQAEEAKALEDALRQTLAANKAASPPDRDRCADAAQHARQKAMEAGRKAAGIAQQITRNVRHQENTLSRLRSAERAGQFAAGTDEERHRHVGLDQIREAFRIASVPHDRCAGVREPTLELLRVLYVTAHPALDAMAELQVRQVQQAFGGAKYRSRIDVQLRPAATLQDLLDGLHEMRPHVMHFSGRVGGDVIDCALLVRALAATEHAPSLLVLNACDSLMAMPDVLAAVPVLVSLPHSALDTTAVVFSQHLYAALSSGQSVGAAFANGKAKMQAVRLDDDADELQELVARNGVDVASLVLVKPHS